MFVSFVIMQNLTILGKKKQVKLANLCTTMTCDMKCLICMTLKFQIRNGACEKKFNQLFDCSGVFIFLLFEILCMFLEQIQIFNHFNLRYCYLTQRLAIIYEISFPPSFFRGLAPSTSVGDLH